MASKAQFKLMTISMLHWHGVFTLKSVLPTASTEPIKLKKGANANV